jgi:hypothetical protein
MGICPTKIQPCMRYSRTTLPRLGFVGQRLLRFGQCHRRPKNIGHSSVRKYVRQNGHRRNRIAAQERTTGGPQPAAPTP